MILPTASASCESALCVSLIFGSVDADRSGGTPTYGNAVPWPKTQASAVQEAPQKRLGRGRPSIPCVRAGVRAQETCTQEQAHAQIRACTHRAHAYMQAKRDGMGDARFLVELARAPPGTIAPLDDLLERRVFFRAELRAVPRQEPTGTAQPMSVGIQRPAAQLLRR